MKTNKKRAPTKDTINSFNDIKKFINSNQTKEEKRMQNQLRENVKMPFKRYKGIKLSVIKKHNKNNLNNQSNDIIAQTHTSKKLMTNIIEKRINEFKEEKKNKKLTFAHGLKKARISDGVMKISRGFINELKNNNSSKNLSNLSKNKGANNKAFNKNFNKGFNNNFHKK